MNGVFYAKDSYYWYTKILLGPGLCSLSGTTKNTGVRDTDSASSIFPLSDSDSTTLIRTREIGLAKCSFPSLVAFMNRALCLWAPF